MNLDDANSSSKGSEPEESEREKDPRLFIAEPAINVPGVYTHQVIRFVEPWSGSRIVMYITKSEKISLWIAQQTQEWLNKIADKLIASAGDRGSRTMRGSLEGLMNRQNIISVIECEPAHYLIHVS